ncbi:MAG TPA: TrkH family potassium uptake protein, partial [Phycisphaeraceae bacterium]|nr:TrkH family potassium uptake protein [Phycisphaeraceae bacterium]
MINIRYALNQLGLLFMVMSAMQLFVAGYGMIALLRGAAEEKYAVLSLVLSAAAGILLGGGMWLFTRTARKSLERREAMLMVALSWLIGAAHSGLPFYLWAKTRGETTIDHAFRSFINCYFEAMSGLTTTGATVLTHIDRLPHSILLWRAMTHWLGGLGIVVLFVAVLPSLGAGGKKLFRVEAPGPEPEGVTPHIRETARILWIIYLGMTVLEILALRLAGMSYFDATCHTFATLATGGFSTIDASVGGFNSWAIHIIIIVFMILAGVNFGLYYRLIRRQFRAVFRDAELRLYLLIILVSTVLITLAIMHHPLTLTTGEKLEPSLLQSFRHSLFTTVSIQTTTGFCTADFNEWPYLARSILIILMFIGASAGSTGGGIKVIRLWIVIKVIAAEIERAFRPNVIRPVKVSGSPVDPRMRLATVSFVFLFTLLFAAGTFLLIVFEQAADQPIDLATAGSASMATLCNIGPGLNMVGAIENYSWFTDASKVVMSILM